MGFSVVWLAAGHDDGWGWSGGAALVFDSDAEGLGGDAFRQIGHDDVGVALVVGVEGAGGDGRGAVGGDDPEFVGFVGPERVEVAGEEDEGALFRIGDRKSTRLN